MHCRQPLPPVLLSRVTELSIHIKALDPPPGEMAPVTLLNWQAFTRELIRVGQGNTADRSAPAPWLSVQRERGDAAAVRSGLRPLIRRSRGP